MRLEPIANPTLTRRLAPPALALLVTFVIAALLALIAGGNPFAVLRPDHQGRVRVEIRALLETLNRATPLIFTGLAIAVAFRAKLWNIGAEAQLYAGAVMTAELGHRDVKPGPARVLLPLIAVASMIAGAVVLLVPALLKTRLGVDEVVTTLLFNFIFLLFVSYLLEGPAERPDGHGLAQIRAPDPRGAPAPHCRWVAPALGLWLGADRGACGLGDRSQHHARL